jgi:NAD+ synthase
MNIDSKKETKKIIDFIQDVCQKTGKQKVVIACSGGIDSSVALALLIQALGVENVFALFLPYKNLNPQGLQLAKQMAGFFRIPDKNVHTIDLGKMVDPAKNILLDDEKDIAVRLGNIMARIRMIAIYDFAKKHDALVCGTENKSEYYLGYYTRFGDEASDFEPIRHLYKTEVYELAKYLQIPKEIIEQKPTAGLWEGQTDEGEMGFSYQEADQVFHRYYGEGKEIGELVQSGLLNTNKIIAFAKKNDYKHHVPYLLTEKD